MNFECPLSAADPNHPALITEEKTFTYRELHQLTAGLCLVLSKTGVQEGHKVAFVAQATEKTILTLFALFRLRAIACPLSTRLPPSKVEESAQKLGALHLLDLEKVSFTSADSSSSLLSTDQLGTFLFTSGTTAEPKIACHTLGNHLYSALGLNATLALSPEHRWPLSLPLFHIGGIGILFRCFLAGCIVLLTKGPATHLSFVATQLYRLLQEPGDHSYIRCILLGGGPIPPDLYQKAKDQNIPVFPTYGLTEMSSAVTLDGYPPLADREVSLASDGEILVRGKTLFQGYYSQDGGVHLPLTPEGWFATGDLGVWTAAKNLQILGRKDNLFISGGENIQPEEIENLLCALPGIAQAIVVPLSDPEFGARPIAFIADETEAYSPISLNAFLQEHLPRFKLPIRYLPLPEHHRTAKPSRPQLTALAQQTLD